MTTTPVKHIFKNTDVRLHATLRLIALDEPFFGPGPLQLMREIDATGSINQAAKNMGMSYKKALMLINALHAQTSKPLILTQTGGNYGGGAVLTEEGRALMQYYEALNQRFQDFLQEENKNLNA
jgi:molybdate transport system regulatory protein